MAYFSNCTSNSSLQKALEAYTDFLSTTVPGAEESCRNPCQFSLVRPKTYFTMAFAPSSCMETSEYPVTLRIPTTILLTKSTFSYPFMTFAADLGGEIIINKRYHLLNWFEQSNKQYVCSTDLIKVFK
jgi:hypothetical protein